MTHPSNTSVTAQFGAGEREEKTKLAYVKRWRTVVRLPEQYADEIVEALRAAPVSHTSVKDGGVDPADLWEEWLAETDEEYRTPQSALAFAVDRLTAPTGSDAVADGARDIVKRLLAFYVGNPGPKTQVHYPPICKEAADTITLLRSGNQHMCEEIERLRSAPVADGARDAKIAELEAKVLMLDGTRALEGIGIDTHATMVALCKTLTAKQIAAETRVKELEAALRSAPVKAVGSEALRLLAAEDARQEKLHELLETIREQIRLGVEPEHRPDGLFQNIQDAVYAMRGRTLLMNDIAITAALAHPGSGDAEPGAWRPIQTAPMDGTAVLLAIKYSDDEWCQVQGWYEAGIADRRWYDVYHEHVIPDYWQPLQSPPPPLAALATPQAPGQTLQHHTGDGE